MIFHVVRQEVDLQANGAGAEQEEDVGDDIGRIGAPKKLSGRKRWGVADRAEGYANLKNGKVHGVGGVKEAKR